MGPLSTRPTWNEPLRQKNTDSFAQDTLFDYVLKDYNLNFAV